MKEVEFSELLGKVLVQIKATEDEIVFFTEDGEVYKLWHEQDGCETVKVEDVVGDWEDLIGEPILVAEEVSSDDSGVSNYFPMPLAHEEFYKWTYYKLDTRKGGVSIRWYGVSNG